MDLDYYLWKNKITFREFTKKVGIAGSTLCEIVAKRRSPKLFTAVKIVQATEGEVTFVELLCIPDRTILIDRAREQGEKDELESSSK